ncbi:MAG: right-handed parallel beta-helix repeat-containing protein, partial [Clostridia bacterium]|nr:right-handed parallel beta-helix repeat-containing protein [Clostridia bacterium]
GENRKGKYFQNMTKLKNNNSKGITLIALVITVIVLLILAGVSISAITGNESAMEKAKQAKTENEAADDLDSVKLAVVDAVAHGTTGYVNGTNLANALEGKIDSDQITAIRANANGPWDLTTSKGTYTIHPNGNVNSLKTVMVNNEEELIEALQDSNCIIKLTSDIALKNTLKITSDNIFIQSSDSIRRKIYAVSNFVAESYRMIIIGDGTNVTNFNIKNVDLVADANDDNKYAVLLINSSSQLNIKDSKVTGGHTPNVTHGAGGMSYGKVTMDNVEICDNYGWRCGGFYTQAGAETYINNSLIHDNAISLDYAGGLYVNSTGKITVENSKIYNNTARGGSAIFSAGDVELTNVEIYNNTPGAAIWMTNWGTKPILTINNCNFHDNTQDIYQ